MQAPVPIWATLRSTTWAGCGPTSKGSSLDGLSTQVRCRWIIGNTLVGDRRATDFRTDTHLPINLLRRAGSS